MDFAGLLRKFPSDRLLTEDEKKLQLKQKQLLDIAPHYQLSVIEMNSTYLESIDKWYAEKGTITAAMLTLAGIFITGFFAMLYVVMTRDPSSGLGTSDTPIMIFAGVTTLPVILTAAWLIKKDAFAYTHYPIRFDRSKRMVYVFRTDGTVLSSSWDTLFFTIKQVDHGHKFWNILGHVMASDGVTVKESFALGLTSDGSPDGIAILRSHWEFIRRYMEVGPTSVIGQVEFCMPIKDRYESMHVAVHRFLANASGGGAFFLPARLFSILFYTFVLPFRFIAMRTSKIPRWPNDVEVETAIIDGDPYAIKGSARGDRISIFPAAAQAADVRFTGPPQNPVAREKKLPEAAMPLTRQRNERKGK